MRIYSSTTGKVAYRVRSRNTGHECYDCYLQERDSNEKHHARLFENIEDAAKFLIENPGSGIRMSLGGAIINSNIVIERDD